MTSLYSKHYICDNMMSWLETAIAHAVSKHVEAFSEKKLENEE